MALQHRHDPAAVAQRKQQRQAVRNAMTRLQQIEDNVEGANTAQTQAAIRDMAKYMQRLIRMLVD